MSDEKEDYKIDDQAQEAAPSGFDLAKIVSGMLNDPETFDRCQRLGEAVLAKTAKQEPKRRDPKVDELIYFAGMLKTAVVTCGVPYVCSMKLVNADLLDDIFTIVSGIKDKKQANDLLKLSGLVKYGGVCVMSEDVYDQIDDGLAMLIEDLGGHIDP